MLVKIATASDLCTLQGTSTTPGLIYNFLLPRQISSVLTLIAAYMALSRVQSLQQPRSIGLTPVTKELIDNGPPEGFMNRLLEVFGETSADTQKAMNAAMAELGWV